MLGLVRAAGQEVLTLSSVSPGHEGMSKVTVTLLGAYIPNTSFRWNAPLTQPRLAGP